MIPTVDQALRDLLRKRLPDGTAVLLAVPDGGQPAVSLTLFGLRDDARGRSAGWDDVRAADGTLLGRRPPTRRYELSYVVQAHAADPETEHDLLGQALIALTDEDTGLDLKIGAAMPSELGFPPRASFVLTVNAAYVPPVDTELAKPADEMHLGVARTVRPPAAPVNGKTWARKRIEEAE
ncbi:Pvc16 family protein [Kutzneria buriramensis]|uniref:Uncharacterized protein DUF4255 n=1 Tax=Kutzneria buriramensis TaxID=1045776 RepID=A0A3E0I630_9PSEU|nr:Pvc16 family protein [Kutzneria buriramensis]REH54097.1 uncharacterized protein DUF4255 [Kutzneria buriramensis]